jgi:D-hydroxyproline dehydrogenase subunit alpha
MDACQGRICGPQAEFLFGWRDGAVRPPIFPATLSSIAARSESSTDQVGALEDLQHS